MSKVVELFKPLKKVYKIDIKEPIIDNNVFKLHYRASVLALLLCATMVGWKEYIGDPIQCMMSAEKTVPMDVINSYCWIFPTYTLPSAMRVDGDVAPGVGTPVDGDELKFHKYYQWVCITLFLQAMLFKLPHTLWKACERGRMSSLIKDLNESLITKAAKKERKELLLDYLINGFKKQNNYFYRFVFCEVLNFVNVIAQIYFMDLFLDGDFIKYGTEVLDCQGKYTRSCTYPMDRIFPKESKCDFRFYGPGGSVVYLDALCVLPANVVNEKVYIFLWFWFMSVATVTGLMMIYRALVVISVKVRVYLLYNRAQHISFYFVSYICHQGNIGDWFILYQISRNVDSGIFVELLTEFVENMKNPTRTRAFKLATGEFQELAPKTEKCCQVSPGNVHNPPIMGESAICHAVMV